MLKEFQFKKLVNIYFFILIYYNIIIKQIISSALPFNKKFILFASIRLLLKLSFAFILKKVIVLIIYELKAIFLNLISYKFPSFFQDFLFYLLVFYTSFSLLCSHFLWFLLFQSTILLFVNVKYLYIIPF